MQAVLVKSPSVATIFGSEVNFCAICAESFGSLLLSSATIWSGRPLMPPLALIFSTAMSIAFFQLVPYSL